MENPMKLTEQQIDFFHTFGYLYFPGLFSADEAESIIDEFEYTIQNFGGGKNHDGSKRTMFGGPIEHHPKLCAILDDPRILGVAGGVLGEDFNYAGGDGNYYAGDTGWHPDGSWGQLFSCKIAFYLDPLTRDTGCLRVIPGSQRPEHLVRAEGINPNRAEELFGVQPRDFPGSIAVETNPGDLVIFNHDLYHASFGGGTRRRMFTMNLTRNCKTDVDIATLHKYLSVHSAGGYNIDTGAGMYFPTILETAGENRMIHLRQIADMHDEMFPHLARERRR
jgi:hypothetical protein